MLYISIGIALSVFWIVLSGHYTVITISAAIVTVIGTVLLARRMEVVDDEGHPIHLIPRAVTFWPWLAKEIVKSSWDVSKIILNPKLPVTPTMVRVHASQRDAVGIATYANSITLTPGTITARVSGHEFLVHALTREGAEELVEGTMDRRVKKFEVGE